MKIEQFEAACDGAAAALEALAQKDKERAAEQRPYISQYWVVDEEDRPMLRIVAGPFNEEQEAYWEMDDRPGLCIVETRHSIHQPGEEWR